MIFIDFEQLGNWFTVSAPKVHYLEWALKLSRSDDVPEDERQRFARIVEEHMPIQQNYQPTVWPTRSILFPEPTRGPFFCFSRQKITGSPNYPLSPSVPPMSEAQAEAIDMIHFHGEKHGLTMTLQRGDMLLFNNFALLHGRNAFADV
ncbi:hypothetical protein BDV19DRAFT_395184 [Aspergillus venezuelensis]